MFSKKLHGNVLLCAVCAVRSRVSKHVYAIDHFALVPMTFSFAATMHNCRRNIVKLLVAYFFVVAVVVVSCVCVCVYVSVSSTSVSASR